MIGIVVLGNKLHNCQPTVEMRGRVAKALELSKHLGPDFLVLSGGRTSPECSVAESEVMLDILGNTDDLKFKVFVEKESTTTIENAIYTRKILDKMHFKGTLYITTSCYHISRSIFIFRSVFPNLIVNSGTCDEYNSDRILTECDKYRENMVLLQKIQWDRADYFDQYKKLIFNQNFPI